MLHVQRLTPHRALLLLILLLMTAHTTLGGDLAATTSQRWLEDIDHLVERLHVMHPDVYAYTTQAEFDGAVANLKRRVPESTENEIVMGIHELLGLMHDAHTSVVPWKMGRCNITDGWSAFPVTFYRFTDGLFIMAADDQHRDLVGQRVVSIGGVDPDEALARMGRLVGADNAQGRLVMGSIYLSMGEALEYCGLTPDRTRLHLRLLAADGHEHEQTLTAGTLGAALQALHLVGNPSEGKAVMSDAATAPSPLYLSRPGDAYWFEYLPEHEAMYVHLLHMEPKAEEDFAHFYARMFDEFDRRGARTLILDIRNNGGGDHHELPLLKGVLARPELDHRDHLFVIIGRRVVSASQHFLTQFKMYTNATFVGEPTSSRPNFFGAQRFFNLPHSNLPVRTSVIFHQDESGWEMDGTSHPDYLVRFAAADFAENRDPALDLVLDFPRWSSLPGDLESSLVAAYEAGGMETMVQAYEEFMVTPESRYLDEYAFHTDFIWWMFRNKRDSDDYGRYLEFYTQRCPDSGGAWYSLAMRRKLAGDPDAARFCLERSLEAYPGNRPARMQLGLLEFER